MKKQIILTIGLTWMTCLLATSWALAAEQLVFEEQFESSKGTAVSEIRTFDATGLKNLVLQVQNGELDESHRVSSAVITHNGIQILGPSDLNQKVGQVERALAPKEGSHSISVTLRSNPGGLLQVRVFGDLSLNLPPDPGPDGATTLEGVDVNGNGVRDDVERWIGLTYRDSQKARLALTQTYYAMQGFIIHADQGDRDAVYDDMTAFQRAGECLDYLFPQKGYPMLRELKAHTVNTSQRVKADRKASRMLGGGSFPGRPYSKWKESCNFDLEALEN